MHRIFQFSLLFLGLVSMILLASGAEAGAPRLAGSVVKTSGGALSQAKVELLQPGTDKVEHSGYTDSHGRFALRDVSAGRYELRVQFGSRVLTQVLDDGDTTKRRNLSLGSSPKRLTVRVQG